MRNHKPIMIALLAVVLLTMAVPAMSQIVYGQPASVSLRFIYSSWSVETDSTKTDISQWMIPVSGFIPLQDNLELRLFAADASSTADIGETDYTLSGLSDLRLQLNSSFSDDRYLLSAGLNLPTGKKKLSHEEEQPVMAVLTQNYLSFPIRRMGEGLGVNVLAGAATTSGNNRLGGTVMYQLNGSYEAYEGDGDYTPGNMFSVGVNADTRAEEYALFGDIVFTTYGTDQLEDRKVFKQSDQLEFHVGGLYGKDNYGLEGDIRYLLRGRNERYDEEEILDYRLKVYGDEFFISGKFSYRPQPIWYIAPLFELRFISGNEFEDERQMGGANNIGIGVEYGRTLGTGFDFGLGFKYYTGSADGGDIDLSGYRLSAGFTAAL